MTSADRARHTAARFSAAAPPPDTAAPTVRTAPVRSSLDLPPGRHHALRERELELMRELGAVRGIRQYLLAAMVRAYLTDERTARLVDGHLAEDLRKRRRT